jgi:hypothetical protein
MAELVTKETPVLLDTLNALGRRLANCDPDEAVSALNHPLIF